MKSANESHLAQSKAFLSTQSKGYGLMLIVLLVLDFILLKKPVNLSVFYFFNDWAFFMPNWLAAHLTDLGSVIVILGLSLCFLVFRPELMLRFLLASLLCSISVFVLKHYFDFLRPAAVLNSLNIIGNIHFKFSFPSGHTAAAFVFAGSVYLAVSHYGVKLLLITMATFVGISRVIVGAHWPGDIVMGAIIGLCCAFIAARFCPPVWLAAKWRIIGLIVLFVGLVFSELRGEYDFPLMPSVKMFRWLIIFLALILISRHIILYWLIKKPKRV